MDICSETQSERESSGDFSIYFRGFLVDLSNLFPFSMFKKLTTHFLKFITKVKFFPPAPGYSRPDIFVTVILVL